MVKAGIRYHLGLGDISSQRLDEIIVLAHRLKLARETVESKYDDVRIDITSLTDDAPGLSVYLNGKYRGEVFSALEEFIRIAGIPDVIFKSHSVANAVMESYGKKLSGNVLNYLFHTRQVVDKD